MDTQQPQNPMQYPIQPQQPAPKKNKKILNIIGYVAVFIVGIGIGSAGGGSSNESKEATPTTTVTTTVQAGDGETVTETVTVRAEAEKQESPAAASFGGGTKLVGTDIEPGTYRTTSNGTCYWERLSGLSGSLDDIIANDFAADGQQIVEILPSDKAFKSTNCGGWEKVG